MPANIFLSRLQELAAQQSPTLLELVRRKEVSGNDEDATDPRYLRGAFAVIAEYYITGIDKGDIKFATDDEKGQFMWLLQLLVDYATDGRVADLSRTRLTVVAGNETGKLAEKTSERPVI